MGPGDIELSYKEVEQILAAALGITDPDTLRGGFKGRLTHLARLKLPLGAVRLGKGSKVSYSPDHARQLGLALSLEEFNVDPAYIENLLADLWVARLRACFDNAKHRPWLMLTEPRAMSAGWKGVDAKRFGGVRTWVKGEDIPGERVLMINLDKLDEAIRAGIAAVLAARKPAKGGKHAPQVD